jgi:ribosomal protein S14
MKTYSLKDLQISEKDIKTVTRCDVCGAKLRSDLDRELQLCEECAHDQAEYFENC